MTYNVRGLRDYRKVAALSHWVRCNRFSIVHACLQETYLDNNDMAVLNRHFPSASVYLSPGSCRSCGVATIVSDSVTSALAYATDCSVLRYRMLRSRFQLRTSSFKRPRAVTRLL